MCLCCTASKLGPGLTPLCADKQGRCWAVRGDGMRTAGVRERVVKAEDGRQQQPQISDSGWDGRKGRESVHGGVLGLETSTGCRLLPAGWRTVETHGREAGERAEPEWNEWARRPLQAELSWGWDGGCPVA